MAMEEMRDAMAMEVAESDFFIPKDALRGKECKPGDTLTLTVREIDEDGDVGVELAGYGGDKEEAPEPEGEAQLREAFQS